MAFAVRPLLNFRKELLTCRGAGKPMIAMTFLSPSFMFAFLPVALSVYALIPKYLKAYALPLVGFLFYAAINIGSTFALIAMPAILLSVIAAVELYRRRRIRIGLRLCYVFALTSIFAVLVLRVTSHISFFSGVGVIMALMSAASLCSDVLHGNGRLPDTLWDAVVYITFFPCLLAGPFIKYGDFVEKIDRLDFSVANFASGAVSFLIGTVKCVIISAVLGEAYNVLLTALGDSIGLFTAFLLMMIYSLKFFNLLSGYSDMARGLASMFGMRIEKDYGNCFCNVTPCEYIRNFFSSLLDFCRSYITLPVSEVVSGVAGNIVAAVFAAFFYSLIFSSNMETVYTVMIPLSVAMLFIVLRTGKKRRGVYLLPRILGSAGTFILVAAFLWYIKLGGPDNVVRLLDTVSKNGAFYIPPHALSVIGDSKYFLLSFIASVGVWSTSMLFKSDDALLDGKQQATVDKSAAEFETGHKESVIKITAKYVSAVFLLTAFCYAMVILLPQYPELASVNYFFPFV